MRVPERSLIQIANILLRSRRLVILAPAIAGATLLTVLLVLPRTYTTTASFVPQSLTPNRLSSLSGLTAQLGLGTLATGMMTTFASPDFYKDLLQSRAILGELADTSFSIPGHTSPLSLADYWKTPGSTPARQRDAVIRRLRDRVFSIKVDEPIQLVEVNVTTRSAELSRTIVEEALALVTHFNQEKRQSQSAEERRFTGGRLDEARADLRAAEDSVARFMERNRDFRNSPGLTFQYDRLQREVTLRQTLYANLSQSYEQARIEEVRDTPVITVVEQPELAARPDSLHLALKLPIALLAGLLVGIVGALGRESFEREASLAGDDRAEFDRLLMLFRGELRRPWRILSRGPG